MPTAINLAEKLGAFSDHWSPRIVAQFNGHDVMVVKAKGTFVWHSHAEPDDFFLVLKGKPRYPARIPRSRGRQSGPADQPGHSHNQVPRRPALERLLQEHPRGLGRHGLGRDLGRLSSKLGERHGAVIRRL